MTELVKLAAAFAIGQVKARYCRTLDTKDWAAYAGVFTADFELDLRQAGGADDVICGRDLVIRTVRAQIERATTVHQVHSPEMIFDDEGADVIWAMQDHIVWDREKARELGMVGLTGFGHYHERYVCRDGGWLIARQRLTRLHMEFHPLA